MMETLNPGQVFADYMDGKTARVQRVAVSLEDSGEAAHYLAITLPDDTRLHWPVSDIRSIPDQADQSGIVLGRASQVARDYPERIVVREAHFTARLHRLCPDLKRRHKDPNVIRRLAILSAAALASVALIVFVLVPVMADQMALILPQKGEKALGDTTFEQIRVALGENTEFGLPLCEDPAGIRALEKMVDRLNSGANLPYQISIHVLDHPMVNAFALPGGHIVLFRGLLKDADSAEEIAGVLGHEMGHLDHRDPTRLALRSAGSVGCLA